MVTDTPPPSRKASCSAYDLIDSMLAARPGSMSYDVGWRDALTGLQRSLKAGKSRKDNSDSTCPKCGRGILEERSLQDDWDGLLTCGYCFIRTPRWTVLPYDL